MHIWPYFEGREIHDAVATLKGKANDAAFTPEGDIRFDRVAKALGGVAGTALVLGLLRRTFNKG